MFVGYLVQVLQGDAIFYRHSSAEGIARSVLEYCASRKVRVFVRVLLKAYMIQMRHDVLIVRILVLQTFRERNRVLCTAMHLLQNYASFQGSFVLLARLSHV